MDQSERIDRLEDKLDAKFEKVIDQIYEINKTLSRLTDIVEIHERRSLALEDYVKALHKEIEVRESALENKINPIEKHVNNVEFFGSISLKILAALAAIASILKVVDMFK